MRKIEVHVSNGLVGCTRRWTIEVEDDDCDPDNLDEITSDEVFNRLEYGWKFADEQES